MSTLQRHSIPLLKLDGVSYYNNSDLINGIIKMSDKLRQKNADLTAAAREYQAMKIQYEAVCDANNRFAKMYEDFGKNIEALDYASSAKHQRYKNYRKLQKYKVKYDKIVDIMGKHFNKYSYGTFMDFYNEVYKDDVTHSYNRFVLASGFFRDTITFHGSYPSVAEALKGYDDIKHNPELNYCKIYDTYTQQVVKKINTGHKYPIDREIKDKTKTKQNER